MSHPPPWIGDARATLAAAEPHRIRVIDAAVALPEVEKQVIAALESL